LFGLFCGLKLKFRYYLFFYPFSIHKKEYFCRRGSDSYCNIPIGLMRNPLASSLLRPGFNPGSIVTHSRKDLPPVSTPRKGDIETLENDAEQAADTSEGLKHLIHIAANEGDIDALRDALRKNPNFHPFDDSGKTPLYFAVAQSNMDCVELLLEHREDLLELGDIAGDKPIHVAALFGNKQVLRTLLGFAAVVNSRNNDGSTAMHMVSTLECAKELISFGADLLAVDHNGRVPLFSTCARNKVSIVTEILNDPNHDAGRMVSMQDSFGDTALHAAASNGSLDCIKAMKGFITVEIFGMVNNQGYAAEQLGEINKQEECVEYLRSLRKTVYRSNQQRKASVSRDADWNQFSNTNSLLPALEWGFQTSNYGGISPGSPYEQAGYRPQSAYSNQVYQQPTFYHNQSRYSLQRPQTAYHQPTYQTNEVQDVWGAFSAPYEESFDEYGRPKTPWTLRREQATMEDWHGEWAEFVDNETGNPFWWNSITGQCQWEVPQRVKEDLETEGDYVSEAQQIRQRSVVVDKFGDWTECEDPVTGDSFFYNDITGECEWELPTDIQFARDEEKRRKDETVIQGAQEEAAVLLWNMKHNSERWRAEHDSESGATYYVNNTTGETSWDSPEEFVSKSTDELQAMKETLKQEAAKELEEKLKSIISSTEEERTASIDKMRKEFEEQMKHAAEQTQKLAQSIAAEKDAERKKRELEILKIREKDGERQAKEKTSEEKSELLAEHDQELKQLASVLSADRMRQNERLQEKLLERRRTRALKRAQLLNQAKANKSPKSASKTSPIPILKQPITSDRKKEDQPIQIPAKPSRNLETIDVEAKTERKAVSLDDLITEEMDLLLKSHVADRPDVGLFVSTHLQYMPSDEISTFQVAEKGQTCIPVLWAIFHKNSMEDNANDWVPLKATKSGISKFLESGKLKLMLSDRENLLEQSFKAHKSMSFRRFKEFLVDLVTKLECSIADFYSDCVLPIVLQGCFPYQSRSKMYQSESRKLATVQVRKILQSNVLQLKSLYTYFTLVAEKQKEGCPKKTISLRQMLYFGKQFNLLGTCISPHEMLQLYIDMTIRKPGQIGSLRHYELPFNQWVQMLFHLALRNGKSEGSEAHQKIIGLFEFMDKAGTKQKLHRSLQPFICILSPDNPIPP